VIVGLATWGLFVAWLVHDVEELVTMPYWGRRNADRLRRRYPRVPERVWHLIDFSPAHVYLAIGMVGVVMLAAAWDGARTGGRSAVFQIALAGFGLHGLVHLGQSALARGYTPGVLTAPVVVLPFSLWAWWALARHGVPGRIDGTGILLAILLLPLLVGGAHALARGVLALGRR
jgi:hypothetical protein